MSCAAIDGHARKQQRPIVERVSGYMAYLLLIIATIAFVELFVRFRVVEYTRASSDVAAKSAAVIRNGKVSDHWKEKALPAYAQKLFIRTMKLLAMLLVIFSPFALAWGAGALINAPFGALAVSWPGIGFSIVVAFAYLFVRGRVGTKGI